MSSDNKNVPIDYNVKEIIDNLDKKKVLTPEDKKRIEESLNFEGAIEKIDISNNSNRVIFTDGEEQLVFEDGEFFMVSSTDSQKSRKKIKREDARNMYIEYFIKYQLNPIIKQRENDELARTIFGDPQRENLKDKEKNVKNTLGNKVKNIADNESKNILTKSKEDKTKQKLR